MRTIYSLFLSKFIFFQFYFLVQELRSERNNNNKLKPKEEKMKMKPKKRVLTALSFREPDRVPIVIGPSNSTGVSMAAYNSVRRLSGLPEVDASEPSNYLYGRPDLGTASVDEAAYELFGTDVRSVLDQEPPGSLRPNAAGVLIDSWGTNYMRHHPLAAAQTPDDIAAYKGWPDVADPTRMAGVRERAKSLADAGEYAVMGVPWLLFPVERAFALQGMDVFLENLAGKPDVARALLRRNLECCEGLMERFLGECGEYLDIIKIGDDLGTQTSLMMSPRMYRRIIKPIHAEFVQFIKRRTNAKVFFHTDGDVAPLVDDFMEIGIDILNPIQTSAGKMADLAALREKTRGRMTLCGAVDTHRILPFGTQEEVDAEVHRVMRLLAPGGGYMLGSVHTIMPDVPPENILAMINAAKKYGTYPIN